MADTPETKLKELLDTMQERTVLVVGDIMLDKFVYGHVERISPESPVPILSIKREDEMLGGAGNALANLVGLNVKAKIVSVIGEDTAGANIREQLNVLGVDDTDIVVDSQRPTTTKTRFLAGHQQLLRADFEHKAPLNTQTQENVLSRIQSLLTDTHQPINSIIISDYGKGLLSQDVLRSIIDLAQNAEIPVLVDPKGRDFTIYRGATAVTPNKKELSEATQGRPVDNDFEVVEAAHVLLKDCDIHAVVATRSKDGISVIEQDADPVHFRSADIEVFDVSGAGDSVIAAIGAAVAAGGSLAQAASLANLAGSIVVTKVGTAPIRIQELYDALQSDLGDILVKHYAKSKTLLRQADCLPWDEAAERIKRWKSQSFRVGFTNGCFDVLHAGHVSYLNQARELCDRLVVGLNSDSSVKILKGESRPVHDEASRADVLGALSSVDLVVLFGAKKAGDDNTANALLNVIKPDLYVKGGDYTVDQIPETPTVQAYGGEVRVMSEYEGHSTTNSIKRMKAS